MHGRTRASTGWWYKRSSYYASCSSAATLSLTSMLPPPLPTVSLVPSAVPEPPCPRPCPALLPLPPCVPASRVVTPSAPTCANMPYHNTNISLLVFSYLYVSYGRHPPAPLAHHILMLIPRVISQPRRVVTVLNSRDVTSTYLHHIPRLGYLQFLQLCVSCRRADPA